VVKRCWLCWFGHVLIKRIVMLDFNWLIDVERVRDKGTGRVCEEGLNWIRFVVEYGLLIELGGASHRDLCINLHGKRGNDDCKTNVEIPKNLNLSKVGEIIQYSIFGTVRFGFWNSNSEPYFEILHTLLFHWILGSYWWQSSKRCLSKNNIHLLKLFAS